MQTMSRCLFARPERAQYETLNCEDDPAGTHRLSLHDGSNQLFISVESNCAANLFRTL